MKRIFSAVLIALLLLSMTACAETTQPTEAETVPVTEVTEPVLPANQYRVNHLTYPARLGESTLGEDRTRELYQSLPAKLAKYQINNVADALYYLQSMADDGVTFTQPIEVCNVFLELLESDYEEVGQIRLKRSSWNYTVAYVKQDGYFFPFDLFNWYQNPESYTWIPCNDYQELTDKKIMAQMLMSTFPHNEENKPMTSWSTRVTSTYRNKAEMDLMGYLVTPQYTQEQLEQWVREDLTLEQWADRIKVPVDAIAALNALGYRSMLYDDNAEISRHNGIIWGGNWNAQKVFDVRSSSCAGTSHIMNALLSGDFDEQGYVGYNGNYGGHIFNYFMKDGMYAMCDFVGLFTSERMYIGEGETDYIVYLGSDLQAFSDDYMNGRGHNDPEDSEYIYHLFMYPQEGVNHPKGFDSKSPATKFGNRLWDVLPEIFREDYVFLYEREGYPIRWKPIADPATWPEILR